MYGRDRVHAQAVLSNIDPVHKITTFLTQGVIALKFQYRIETPMTETTD